MKKTTIRIAGFLLAATCVALLASCKNNTAPATKKDDGKKPTPTTPTFDKSKLRGIWKVESFMDVTNTTIAKKGYLLHFDDKDALRVAYSADISVATPAVNTRAAKVEWSTEGTDKIKIAELKLGTASKFELADSDKKLNITVGDKKIVLVKVAKDKIPSTVKFDQDSTPDAVVNAFNVELFGILPFTGFTHPANTSFKIVELNGMKPGKKASGSAPKVYHVVFTEEGKFILTVDQGAGTSKSKVKDYKVDVTPAALGSAATMKISAAALELKSVLFTVKTEGADTIITIGKTILTTKDAEAHGTLNGYTEKEEDTMKAIGNFGKNE